MTFSSCTELLSFDEAAGGSYKTWVRFGGSNKPNAEFDQANHIEEEETHCPSCPPVTRRFAHRLLPLLQ